MRAQVGSWGWQQSCCLINEVAIASVPLYSSVPCMAGGRLMMYHQWGLVMAPQVSCCQR